MRRLGAALAIVASIFVAGVPSPRAFAQPKPKATAAARADAGAAVLADAGTRSLDTTLPSDHPPLDDGLPAGHPQVDDGQDDEDQPPPNPHGKNPNPHGGGADPDSKLFKPPPDTAEDDPSLPLGSIVATIKDGHDKPIPAAEVTLGILHSSVAKGDSRERKVAQCGDTGNVRFDDLQYGSGTTYRVITTRGSAQFADTPFALGDKFGKRVVLHVYDVTTNIDEALVGMQGLVFLQLREDTISIEELFNVFNLGSVAWVADAKVGLPSGFKAFNKPEAMDDVRFEETKTGAALRGTITPGRHDTNFRYSVTLEENERQVIRIELPPHVAQVRVIAEASKTMGLNVAEFPASQKSQDRDGKRVLITERQVTRQEGGIQTLEITLSGLPTPGPGRWVAIGIAAMALIIGFVYLQQTGGGDELDADAREDLIEAREALLGEIVLLEKLHRKGEIGPKTYTRLRASLLDALARIVGMLDASKASRRARVAGQA